MRTLIHLTGPDEADWGHALRSARLLRGHDDLVHDDVVLLPHRAGVRLVAPDSPLADEVGDALAAGVAVRAGATCFDALGLPRAPLDGVDLVPSGVAEVVRLQARGYHYVKVP